MERFVVRILLGANRTRCVGCVRRLVRDGIRWDQIEVKMIIDGPRSCVAGLAACPRLDDAGREVGIGRGGRRALLGRGI